MLVAMETKDSLRRGAIMVVTKNFGLAHAEQKCTSAGHNSFSRTLFEKNTGCVLPSIFFSEVWWEVTT